MLRDSRRKYEKGLALVIVCGVLSLVCRAVLIASVLGFKGIRTGPSSGPVPEHGEASQSVVIGRYQHAQAAPMPVSFNFLIQMK